MDLPPEPPRIELHGVVEVGLASTPELDPIVSIDLARLMTRFEAERYGGMVQVQGSDELELSLLDARLWVGDRQGLSLEAGRMKTPFSQDMQVGAPDMLLPTRPLIVGIAPRRDLGAQARLKLGERVLVRGGWFVEAGPVMAMDVSLSEGLALHAAGTLDGADLGLAWERGGTRVAVEGLAMHDKSGWQGGGALEAGKAFELGWLTLQPVLGWDTLAGSEIEHCGTVALRGMHEGITASVSYEALLGEKLEQRGRVQLQAAF